MIESVLAILILASIGAGMGFWVTRKKGGRNG